MACGLLWTLPRSPIGARVALALLSLLVAAGTVLAFGACLRALIDRGFAQGNAGYPELCPGLAAGGCRSCWRSPRARASTSCRGSASGWWATCARDLFAHVASAGAGLVRDQALGRCHEPDLGRRPAHRAGDRLVGVGGAAQHADVHRRHRHADHYQSQARAAWRWPWCRSLWRRSCVFGRKVRALSREAQARMADMVSEGGETLDAVRTVQAFAQEGHRAAKRFGRGHRTGLHRRHPARCPARHHDDAA